MCVHAPGDFIHAEGGKHLVEKILWMLGNHQTNTLELSQPTQDMPVTQPCSPKLQGGALGPCIMPSSSLLTRVPGQHWHRNKKINDKASNYSQYVATVALDILLFG